MKLLTPPYMSRETLAAHMELKPGAIDQLHARGLIPDPVMIGDALRWCWEDVDAMIKGRKNAEQQPRQVVESAADQGARIAAEAAAARRASHKQDRATVSVPAQVPGHRPG
jgi:predicted DNA-binding transcriptional regulator AlpA